MSLKSCKLKHQDTTMNLLKSQITNTTSNTGDNVMKQVLIQLVRMQNGTFMLKETMDVFTKLSIFVSYNAVITQHSLYPKELKSHVHTKKLRTIVYSRSNS